MKRLILLALALVGCATEPTAPAEHVHQRHDVAASHAPLEVIAFQGVPLNIAREMAAAGPAFVDSFTVSCTSAAAVRIRPSAGFSGGGAMVAYTCQNASTTMVQVGDSTVSDPGTTRDAPIYCATNCPSQEWGGNASQEYCRGDTDTTIYCRALISGTSAP